MSAMLATERCTLHEPTGRRRLGFKGPDALAWLQQRGIAVPAVANTWTAAAAEFASSDDLVIRLGHNEFLLDIGSNDERAPWLRELSTPPRGVYAVLREDRGFTLQGASTHAVLAQVCNVNFAAVDTRAQPAFMTLMIGVAVVVVPQGTGEQRRYRFWCDPSFGDYLASSLQDVIGREREHQGEAEA